MPLKMIRRVLAPSAIAAAAAAIGMTAWAGSASVPDWKITGPFGGTATAIALDPSNSNVVLSGGMNSLLFRSGDAGANWELMDFPKLSLSEITSALVDPADSKHYLVGVISAEGGGLFETNDAGKSWHDVKEIRNVGVRALAIAPSKPSRFVAATLQGVWLSDDCGKSWTRISDLQNLEMVGVSAIAVDTKDPNIIYAGTSHLPWKTMDGGKTWQSISTGMIDDSDVFSIYVDPANPSTVLASACSGIYSTDNRGDLWHKLLGIPNTSRRTHVVRQDPTNEAIIYAGTTTGLFKTINRGVTWKSLTDTQVNSMALDPANPSHLYLALQDDGIGKSDNGGQQISLSNHGFIDRTISAVTRSGNKFVAIESQDGASSGIFVSTDSGETWTQVRGQRGLNGVHLKAIAGMQSEDRILLGASSHQLYKSIDGGLVWKPIPVRLIIPPPPPPPPKQQSKIETPLRARRGKQVVHSRTLRPVKPVVKIREINPAEVYGLYSAKSGTKELMFAATDLGLLRSDDAGERWTQVDVGGSAVVNALYFAANSGYMMARSPGGLFASKDYGDHWTEVRFPLPTSDINDIAVPADQNSPLLIATRLGLYSSPDGGSKWFASMGGIPASTVAAVVYGGAQTAYAVEYGRLFQTTDSGASWTAIPTSIPNLRIRQLWMPDIASGRLYGITNDLGIIYRE